MNKPVALGIQDFEEIIRQDCFYIDKTSFIKEWWENRDVATLITRPRRFGKTLTMSMVEKFFSVKYEGRGELFSDFSIWKEQKYRELQGTYPVIFLSFANIKSDSFEGICKQIISVITDEYERFSCILLNNEALPSEEKEVYKKKMYGLKDLDIFDSIRYLSRMLHHYYNKNVIILLDEYDTPMQEAYVNGYWEKLSLLMGSFFGTTFKTNRYLARAIITGITRISKESIFSDLNNLEVVTSTSEKYAASFGFTEEEVYGSLKQYGLEDQFPEVKEWYDGFTFGSNCNIYNPWSITNFLDKKKFNTYWANTSSNTLVSMLIKDSDQEVKHDMERLLQGKILRAAIDEEIVFCQLSYDENAIWSLLLASGYLKVISVDNICKEYQLALANKEVYHTFHGLIQRWFAGRRKNYNEFIKALLSNDIDKFNNNLSKLVEETISYFDKGNKENLESFYHGLVLGIVAELRDKFVIRSNRESGYGRYDVLIESKTRERSYILEFKVASSGETLQMAAKKAIEQIWEKKYDTELLSRGIPTGQIVHYGVAFKGKKVLAISDGGSGIAR